MPQEDIEQKEPKQDSSYIQLDNDAKGAASAAPRSRRRVAAGVLSAFCIVLIVVSLGFVFPSESGVWSITWIERVFSGESAVAPRPVATKVGSSSHGNGTQAKSSDETEKKNEEASKKDADSQGNALDEAGRSSDGTTEGSGQHQSSDQGASNQSGGASSQSSNNGGVLAGGNTSQESSQVTVSVTVTSSAVGNPVSASGTFTFNKGATVYDALCSLGVSVNAYGTSYGTYVAGIGGLAEKEHGGKSGWMYSVNGSTPMVACSGYKLSNGDKVVWYYVTGD